MHPNSWFSSIYDKFATQFDELNKILHNEMKKRCVKHDEITIATATTNAKNRKRKKND